MIGDRAGAQWGFIRVAMGSGQGLRKDSTGAQPKHTRESKTTKERSAKTRGTLEGCSRDQSGL
eukprot:6180119-Alexandrium_andersonii.AAC.1